MNRVRGGLRLVLSACAATALLTLAIIAGARFLQRLPVPELPEPAPSQPDESAAPGSDDANLIISGEGSSGRITKSDVAALRDFLAESPGARLRRALADGDTRWLGMNGLVVEVPGVDDPARALREGRVLLIPGTSDRAISDEHERLIERSRRYARAYNALLSQRASRAD